MTERDWTPKEEEIAERLATALSELFEKEIDAEASAGDHPDAYAEARADGVARFLANVAMDLPGQTLLDGPCFVGEIATAALDYVMDAVDQTYDVRDAEDEDEDDESSGLPS
jgi:hypothetical protein